MSAGWWVSVLLLVLPVGALLPWAAGRRGPPARRRARRSRAPEPVDVAVLLDLADAALAAGTSVPGVLRALGAALVPARGEVDRPEQDLARSLRHAGAALLLGSRWTDAWRGAPDRAVPLAEALRPAWEDGVDPGPLLRRAAAAVRAGRQREAQEAAARLGVRLVLPLGLCFLPAFVLLGVVPVVLAAGGALLGG